MRHNCVAMIYLKLMFTFYAASLSTPSSFSFDNGTFIINLILSKVPLGFILALKLNSRPISLYFFNKADVIGMNLVFASSLY